MEQLSHLSEEWLSSNHSISIKDFKCTSQNNNSHVQLFLQEQAMGLMSKNIVRTRLFFDQHRNLIGFYSLFNDTIKMNKGKKKELDIRLPLRVTEIPSIRLHYIGVDDKYKGYGYGYHLMASVIDTCISVATVSGCSLIAVEASEDVIDFYKKFDFVHIRKEKSSNKTYYLMALSTKNLIDI